METNLKYINLICADLGGVTEHATNLAGENEICTLLGGTGGHVMEISALNEICTIQVVAAGHVQVLSALNAIAGVTKVTNLEAWKYIQVGTKLNLNRFVRPAGTIYGTADGKSYDNAWSGFSAIDWAQMLPGMTLNVCGTHLETLNVGASGTILKPITINFANILGSGSIDGRNTLFACFDTNDNDYLTINGDLLTKTFRRGTNSCTYTGDVSLGIIYNHVWASESGNQAFQNEGAPVVTYNHCKGSDSVDDGLSGHGTSNITMNYCEFSGNAQGINMIMSCVGVANYCTTTGNTDFGMGVDVLVDFTANHCIINDNIAMGSPTNPMKFNNCIITNSTISTGSIFTECYFKGTSHFVVANTVKLIRCFVESSFVGYFIATSGVGIATLDYCIVKLLSAALDSYLVTHASSGTLITNNSTFIGYGKSTGRAALAQQNGLTFNNCILTYLKNGVVNYATTLTLNNCNIYDVTTPKFNTVIDNNPVTGNPNLQADYSLGAGSVAIGSGLTITGKETGIASANWGDGLTTYPVVTTKLQAAAWDLGAIIH